MSLKYKFAVMGPKYRMIHELYTELRLCLMRAVFLAFYSLSEDFIALAFVSIQTLPLSIETYLQTADLLSFAYVEGIVSK